MRIIVAFPAGGPVDFVARVVAEQLGRELGRAVVVENKPGGNGAVAAQVLAQSPADGSVLWLSSVGAVAINPLLYPGLGYDVARDLAPVSLVVNTDQMLVVRADDPARDAITFVARAKAGTAPAAIASPGTASIPHLTIEQLSKATGTPFLHVPYKGAAPAITAVLGGEVAAFIGDVAGLTGQVKAGRLRAVGIASSRRNPLLPDVPTFAEQGMPGLEANNWYGFFVSARTSAPVIDALSAAVAARACETCGAREARGERRDPRGLLAAATGRAPGARQREMGRADQGRADHAGQLIRSQRPRLPDPPMCPMLRNGEGGKGCGNWGELRGAVSAAPTPCTRHDRRRARWPGLGSRQSFWPALRRRSFPDGPITLIVGSAGRRRRRRARLLAQNSPIVPPAGDRRESRRRGIADRDGRRGEGAAGRAYAAGHHRDAAIDIAVDPAARPNMLQDFAPVPRSRCRMVLVVNSSMPVHSVQELLAEARACPASSIISTPGVKTTMHLEGELFKLRTGADIVHIPYKGRCRRCGADERRRRDDVLVAAVGAAVRQGGKLRALAVAGHVRSPLMPDVPTMAESGVDGVDATVWYGMLAPAGTPADVVETLARAVREASRSAEYQQIAAAWARAVADHAGGIRPHAARRSGQVQRRHQVRRRSAPNEPRARVNASAVPDTIISRLAAPRAFARRRRDHRQATCASRFAQLDAQAIGDRAAGDRREQRPRGQRLPVLRGQDRRDRGDRRRGAQRPRLRAARCRRSRGAIALHPAGLRTGRCC